MGFSSLVIGYRTPGDPHAPGELGAVKGLSNGIKTREIFEISDITSEFSI